MANYIDGFVFPIPRVYFEDYKSVAKKVAKIWKEHGALAYFEFIGDDMFLEGTKSFIKTIEANEDEEIVFGWVVFPSKEIRELANKKVATDPRISKLVTSLTDPNKLIFDSNRMVYGGFKPLIRLNE